VEVQFALWAANTTDQPITLLSTLLHRPEINGDARREQIKGTVHTGPLDIRDQVAGITDFPDPHVIQPGGGVHKIVCTFHLKPPANGGAGKLRITGVVSVTDQLQRQHIAGPVWTGTR
jgi:hypothetical protein